MAITLHRGTWNSFPSHLIAQPNGDKNGIDNSSRNFVTPMGLKRMSGVWKLLWTFFLKLHGLSRFFGCCHRRTVNKPTSRQRRPNHRHWQAVANSVHLRCDTGLEITITAAEHGAADVGSCAH